MEVYKTNPIVEKRLKAYCKQTGLNYKSVHINEIRLLMEEMYNASIKHSLNIH